VKLKFQGIVLFSVVMEASIRRKLVAEVVGSFNAFCLTSTNSYARHAPELWLIITAVGGEGPQHANSLTSVIGQMRNSRRLVWHG
jgi:hypothetical protein